MLDKEGKLSPYMNVAREIVTALIDRILEVESKNYHNPSLGYMFSSEQSEVHRTTSRIVWIGSYFWSWLATEKQKKIAAKP